MFRLRERGRCGSQAFFISCCCGGQAFFISYVCYAGLMKGTTKYFNIDSRSKFCYLHFWVFVSPDTTSWSRYGHFYLVLLVGLIVTFNVLGSHELWLQPYHDHFPMVFFVGTLVDSRRVKLKMRQLCWLTHLGNP